MSPIPATPERSPVAILFRCMSLACLAGLALYGVVTYAPWATFGSWMVAAGAMVKAGAGWAAMHLLIVFSGVVACVGTGRCVLNRLPDTPSAATQRSHALVQSFVKGLSLVSLVLGVLSLGCALAAHATKPGMGDNLLSKLERSIRFSVYPSPEENRFPLPVALHRNLSYSMDLAFVEVDRMVWNEHSRQVSIPLHLNAGECDQMMEALADQTFFVPLSINDRPAAGSACSHAWDNTLLIQTREKGLPP